MADPVVLIGVHENGQVGVVGLYDDVVEVQLAVKVGHLPSGFRYSIITPPINKAMLVNSDLGGHWARTMKVIE